MHFLSWISTVIFACVAWSSAIETPHFDLQKNQDSSPSPDHGTVATCKRIRVLEKLTNAAQAQKFNFEVMVADDKLSQQEIDWIMSDAGPLASELRDLKSNATLTAQCGVIIAHKQAVADCTKFDKLEKLVELANNKTAYNEHLAGETLNNKQIDQLHKNMEEATVKLQKERTNTTLVTLCNAEPGLRSHGANVAEKQQDGSIGSGEFKYYSFWDCSY
jgi:hypothetical protein